MPLNELSSDSDYGFRIWNSGPYKHGQIYSRLSGGSRPGEAVGRVLRWRQSEIGPMVVIRFQDFDALLLAILTVTEYLRQSTRSAAGESR